MEHPALAEVRRQHVFIENWLAGSGSPDWDLFATALDDDFEMIVPEGTTIPKHDLLEGFRSARGTRPGMRIEIRNARVLEQHSDRAVVRYEEWQLDPTGANQRVSTACLQASKQAPLGWVWTTLHETWLPEPEEECPSKTRSGMDP